ncbi:extracellular solute-binding protein [Thermosipho ferrireducens]|uniref:Extracellular solute-binding protein n=1 Tax=Thermosipho ferrireducens TaxID=2571116 RepID=A0ABX7S934_9BACT|nr:extracellular solute-binding protein [Thermosipho ferrireducens]QTA38365.1 extracellular solute-binding protein [Thermosipho ferrireducens]
MRRILIIIMFVLFSLYVFSDILIFYASSLTPPLKEIAKKYEEKYGEKVLLEPSASIVVARKITELGRRADIALFADKNLFFKMVYPELTDWQIVFASNSIVLAYTKNSRYSEKINSSNFFEILLGDKDVRFGYPDPRIAPLGYRTHFLFQLAERYYNVPGLYEKFKEAKNIYLSRKSIDSLSLLEVGELDYVFEYRSVAKVHNLKYVEFPEEINLSSPEFEDSYEKTVISINNKVIMGSTIAYTVWIPKSSKNKEGAIRFLGFFLSEGLKILEKDGFILIKPYIEGNEEKVPEKIKAMIENAGS